MHDTFSTNTKTSRDVLACVFRTRFPALATGDMYLPRVLIGLIRCLSLLLLGRVILQMFSNRCKCNTTAKQCWFINGSILSVLFVHMPLLRPPVPLELRVDKYRYHISDVINNGVDVKTWILTRNIGCFDIFQYWLSFTTLCSRKLLFQWSTVFLVPSF